MPVTINGSAGVTTNVGAVYNGLQTDTAKASTSGTSVDFTSIPNWVKRITVMFQGVSTNGTSIPQIQLGVSGSPETTGYVAFCANVQAGTNTTRGTAATTGFILQHGTSASVTFHGSVVITLLGSNTWTAFGGLNDPSGGNGYCAPAGSKALAGTLNMIRITTVNGTDTFDAGSINIIYE